MQGSKADFPIVFTSGDMLDSKQNAEVSHRYQSYYSVHLMAHYFADGKR
jgi:hypothetical protein